MIIIRRIFFLALLLMTPALAAAQNASSFDAAQLDQITAAISLYPDTVLGEILIAATYPDQVDLAADWLDDPLNAGLQGDALRDALQSQPWDNSVKALVSAPRLLFMLSDNDEWMRQLGAAFTAQQGDVMDSVQRLRWQAYRAGALQPGDEQGITLQNNFILIQSAAPVIQLVGTVPAWDWQHHRIDGHESPRHIETAPPQPQTQPQPQHMLSAPEAQEPVAHGAQGRPLGLPMIQPMPQTNLQDGAHPTPPPEQLEKPKEQGTSEAMPAPPGVKEP